MYVSEHSSNFIKYQKKNLKWIILILLRIFFSYELYPYKFTENIKINKTWINK